MMVIPRQKGNIELPVTIVTSGSSMFPLLKGPEGPLIYFLLPLPLKNRPRCENNQDN